MTNETLRKEIAKYLEKPDSIKQNELARRAGIAPATLSYFLKGRNDSLTHEEQYKIIEIVSPWRVDPQIIAGKLKATIVRQRHPESKMRQIILELSRGYLSPPL